MDGIEGVNLAWFGSNLTNRIQYISITCHLETDTKNICCRVSQGSILGRLLFLLYVNHIHNSTALDPVMFADDTNLFYELNDLKTSFSLVNQEQQKINKWFAANKLSLNVEKTKYSLFQKPSRRDDLPLLLPKLLIKKHKVERVESIKFLGVLLDENLS